MTTRTMFDWSRKPARTRVRPRSAGELTEGQTRAGNTAAALGTLILVGGLLYFAYEEGKPRQFSRK